MDKEIVNKSSCECESCKNACKFNPGWFLPGEAERASKFLEMKLNEFFKKYLGVNWWVADPPIFVLAPAIISMDAGSEYPGDPRGTCVFFENERCKIHPVKPFECREYIHTQKYINKRHKKVANIWKEHQKQIISLLGREPEIKTFGILDCFSAAGI